MRATTRQTTTDSFELQTKVSGLGRRGVLCEPCGGVAPTRPAARGVGGPGEGTRLIVELPVTLLCRETL